MVLFSRPRYDVVHIVPRIGERSQDVIKYDKSYLVYIQIQIQYIHYLFITIPSLTMDIELVYVSNTTTKIRMLNDDGDNNKSNEDGFIGDATLSLSPIPPPLPTNKEGVDRTGSNDKEISTRDEHNALEDTVSVIDDDDGDAKHTHSHETDSSIDSNTSNINNSNKEQKDEERINYFLRCYEGAMMTTTTSERRRNNNTRRASNHGHNNSTITKDDGSNSMTEIINDDDNDSDEEFIEYNNSTSVMIATSENTIIEVAPSLLDNDMILQSLRSSLRPPESDLADSSDGQYQCNSNNYNNSNNNHHRDLTVALFFKFFKFAQVERIKVAGSCPKYLISGLFTNLSDVRSDLEWAQDAAYRRQNGVPYVAWVDYYAKERRGVLQRPIFTSLTLVICTFTMVWAFYKNDWKIEALGVNPMIGPSTQVLLDMGALEGQPLIEEGKWWLLITPIFLHAGIGHLLLNGCILIFLCRTIERNHGWLHTSIIFIASGMFGNIISVLLQPGFILLGASGGIFGLYGAAIADIVLNSRFFFLVLEERQQDASEVASRKRNTREGREASDDGSEGDIEDNGGSSGSNSNNSAQKSRCRHHRVGFWCYFSLICELFINLSFGLLPYIDNFAHLGGFLFGFCVSLSSLRILSASSFDYRRKQHKKTKGRWYHRLRIMTLRCGGGLSALFLVFVAVMFLRRSDGMTSPCPNCRYVSCIPLPRPWKPNDPNNWWNCGGCEGVTAQVFNGSSYYNSKYYVDLEIRCPSGNIVEVDISGERYITLDEVHTDLQDLCHEFCLNE